MLIIKIIKTKNCFLLVLSDGFISLLAQKWQKDNMHILQNAFMRKRKVIWKMFPGFSLPGSLPVFQRHFSDHTCVSVVLLWPQSHTILHFLSPAFPGVHYQTNDCCDQVNLDNSGKKKVWGSGSRMTKMLMKTKLVLVAESQVFNTVSEVKMFISSQF